MADKKKILDKIKKLLALSENNPSEEEAKAAALKAQKLMSEYHIEMGADFEYKNNEGVFIMDIYLGEGKKWKIPLANIITNSFRCKCSLSGNEYITFMGYDIDVQVSGETFKTLVSIAEKLMESIMEDQREVYVFGFLDGIRQALAYGCTALMTVTPPKVQEAFDKMFPDDNEKEELDFQNGEIFEKGRRDGKASVEEKRLTKSS